MFKRKPKPKIGYWDPDGSGRYAIATWPMARVLRNPNGRDTYVNLWVPDGEEWAARVLSFPGRTHEWHLVKMWNATVACYGKVYDPHPRVAGQTESVSNLLRTA